MTLTLKTIQMKSGSTNNIAQSVYDIIDDNVNTLINCCKVMMQWIVIMITLISMEFLKTLQTGISVWNRKIASCHDCHQV